MVDLSDTVSAAQEGSADAFSELVKATYSDTFSHALRLVGNADDAHDVAQDTYLRAFRSIGRFRGDAHVATWLYRITANCASTLIARRRRSGHETLDTDAAVVDDALDRDPQRRTDANALRERVVEALGQLPDKLRVVIVLRDIYDLSHDAIASQLGITESAAKVRLHRARQKLRAKLYGEANDDLDSEAAPSGEVLNGAAQGGAGQGGAGQGGAAQVGSLDSGAVRDGAA